MRPGLTETVVKPGLFIVLLTASFKKKSFNHVSYSTHTYVYSLHFRQNGWPSAGASTGKPREGPAHAVILTLGAAEETAAQRGLPEPMCAQQIDATAMQSARLASFCIPEEGEASSHPVFTHDNLRGGL